MIFGKYINRYYLKHASVLLLGLAALLTVDYIQLLIPQLYRLVINGVNLGQVVVNGETLLFTKEVLLQHICLPMIWIVVLMVIGRFLWRICFFGSAVRVAADLRERMFDHSRRLSQQYYQVNKVGNLMSLYTNDLDTIQECFGDGIHLFWEGNPKALYEFRDGDKQPVDTYASFEHDSRYSDNIVENAYVDELTNFFAVLKGEEQPRWSFEKDLKAIELMDKIENS